MRVSSCVRSVLVLSTIVISADWGTTPAKAQPMVGLGSLPGSTTSVAFAVSADGSTVVGSSGAEAFVWTAATGMVGMGHLPGLSFSEANGVSADGAMVVGSSLYFDEQSFDFASEAFVWTAGVGMVGLGDLSDAQHPFSFGYAVSADGSTIVGMSRNPQNRNEAFVWTAATEMLGMGYLPGATSSIARGVSADGSTIVGYSDGQAFIWTAATGMVGLGTLSGFTSSHAEGVSADGSTVVGSCVNAQGEQEAFVWLVATGMVGLGHLTAATSSVAIGVSADGSRIVGHSGDQAFVWTAATGMVGLGYLSGDSISAAYAVSADGSTVVGTSDNGAGSLQAYILRVQPEPSEQIAALIQQVYSLNLQHGIANSLDSKLNSAIQAFVNDNANNDGAAVNALNAFILAVQAQSGKKIPTADADELIATATRIIDLLLP